MVLLQLDTDNFLQLRLVSALGQQQPLSILSAQRLLSAEAASKETSNGDYGFSVTAYRNFKPHQLRRSYRHEKFAVVSV